MSDRSNPWQLQAIVCQLRTARNQWRTQNGRVSGEQGGRELPSRAAMAEILEALCGALFPMRLGPVDLREESEDFYVGNTLDAALTALLAQARLELRYAARQGKAESLEIDAQALRLIQDFALALPSLRSLLDTDVLAAYHGDPAARSVGTPQTAGVGCSAEASTTEGVSSLRSRPSILVPRCHMLRVEVTQVPSGQPSLSQ